MQPLPPFPLLNSPAVQATGQITCTVTDSDGAVVTGATIALESQLTHEQNTSRSDGYGNHFIHALGLQNSSAVVLYDSLKNEMLVKAGIMWHPL